MVGSGCKGCGAYQISRTCEELFELLLAVDHQRLQPWGSYHGVSVACYLLQHPDPSSTIETIWGQLELLEGALRDGVDAIHSTSPAPPRQGLPGLVTWDGSEVTGTLLVSQLINLPRNFEVTIKDVAVDGSFPGGGFGQRVMEWADATCRAWRSLLDGLCGDVGALDVEA